MSLGNDVSKPLILVGIATAVSILSLVLPWWELDANAGGFGSFDETAGPFADNDVIDGSDAVIAGLLTLVSTVGTGTAVVLLVRERRAGTAAPAWTAWAALGGGAALLLAALLAYLTWPGDGVGFWDSEGSGGFGVETAASFGWYGALLGGILAMASGVMLALEPRTSSPVTPG